MSNKIVPNLASGSDLALSLIDIGGGTFALAVSNQGCADHNSFAGKFGGYDAKPRVSFNRPSGNTTQYTAGDVIGTSPASVIEFNGVAISPGQGGVVYGATLIDKANQTTKLAAPELWLFSFPPAAVVDNGVFAPTDDELASSLIGVFPFSSSYIGKADAGDNGNVVFLCTDRSFAYLCAAGRSSLYGVLVARNAYTPVSAEQFTVSIDCIPR